MHSGALVRKGKRSRTYWVLLAALSVWPVSAEAERSPRHFKHISTEDGLSHNVVTAILQDRMGFLWFGTQAGLDRYDGSRFITYEHGIHDLDSISSNYVSEILEDSAGSFWVGTLGGGLNLFDRTNGTFSQFTHDSDDPSSISSNLVWRLFEDSSGTLWIGTEDGGLNSFNPETRDFQRFPADAEDPFAISLNYLTDIAEATNGRLWLGTDSAGLDLFDPTRGTIVRYRHSPDDPNSLSDDQIRALLTDRQGTLWVGTSLGIDRFDPETSTFARFSPNQQVRSGHAEVTCLLEVSDSEILVGTYGAGLYEFNKETGTFTAVPRRTSFGGAGFLRIFRLFQDATGAIWVGTYGSGLELLRPAGEFFEALLPSSHGLSSEDITSLSEDRQGGLWIGTFGGGLNWRTSGEGAFRQFRWDPTDPNSLSDDEIFRVLSDRKGRIWAGTWDRGLNILEPSDGHVTRHRHKPGDPTSLSSDRVLTLLEDDRGSIWVGSSGGLDLYSEKDGSFVRQADRAGELAPLISRQVRKLFEDSQSRIWIGTHGGLCILSAPGRDLSCLDSQPADPDSLSEVRISDILEDSTGRIWIATLGEGFYRLDEFDLPAQKATFRRFSETDGLIDDSVASIVETPDGLLWIATKKGLSLFDPRDGASFQNFGIYDGLPSREFTTAASLRTQSHFYWGTNRGLVSLALGSALPPVFESPVVIAALRTADGSFLKTAPLTSDETFDVAFGSILTADFAVLDYGANVSQRFAYRLSNDAEWIDLGNRSAISLAGLDPGEYELSARGRNDQGVIGVSGSVKIRVVPPFWRTGWFRLTILLAVGGSLWAGHFVRTSGIKRRSIELEKSVAQRTRDLKEANRELEAFSYSVSHDLRSPLRAVNGYLAILSEDHGEKLSKEAMECISRAEAGSVRMGKLIDALLEFSRLGRRPLRRRQVDVNRTVGAVIEDVKQGLGERSIEFRVEPLPSCQADPDLLHQVFENLISNAVKYTRPIDEAAITVGGKVGSEATYFVADNGVGFDMEHSARIFGDFERLHSEAEFEGSGVGLALVRRIVTRHGGRIWADSKPGEGATFYFTITSF